MKPGTLVQVSLTAEQVATLLEVVENGRALHPADGVMLAAVLRAAVSVREAELERIRR